MAENIGVYSSLYGKGNCLFALPEADFILTVAQEWQYVNDIRQIGR